MELNLNPDIIRQIIQHARVFHAKEWANFRDKPNQDPQAYDWLQFLADHENDLSYQEVVSEINNLEPDQQITLITMLYIGRGDYSIDEWEEAREEAEYHFRSKTGQYLLKHPLLANHLEEALTQLGYITTTSEKG